MKNIELLGQGDFTEINKDLYIKACTEILNKTGEVELDLEHSALISEIANKFNIPQKNLWDFIAEGNFEKTRKETLKKYDVVCHKIYIEMAKERGAAGFNDEKYILDKIDKKVPLVIFKKYLSARDFYDSKDDEY